MQTLDAFPTYDIMLRWLLNCIYTKLWKITENESNLITGSYWKGLKTLWQKEKLLSFCHNVLKRRLLQGICRLELNYRLNPLWPFPSYRRFLTPLQQTTFWKHSDKRRNCSFWGMSTFVTMFSKSCLLQIASESIYMRERVKQFCNIAS